MPGPECIPATLMGQGEAEAEDSGTKDERCLSTDRPLTEESTAYFKCNASQLVDRCEEAESEECEDDQIYCVECRSFYTNQCETHGPLSFIHDSPTPMGVPQRALLTLPLGLVIGRSTIPEAGLGVFNQGQTLPAGTHFGPYEGDVTSREEATESGYSWVICRKKNHFEYIDGTRDTHSNWMRYVNCARNEDEQNLVAFQHRGRVLYRCLRPVLPGQELLLWYEDEYAKELGITWDYLWDRKSSPAERSAESRSPVFPCPHCRFSFSAEIYLQKHIRRSHSEESAKLLHSVELSTVVLPPTTHEDQLPPLIGVPTTKKQLTPSHICTNNREHLSHEGAPVETKPGQNPDDVGLYCCAQCGRSSANPEGLSGHQCMQTGEGPYPCPLCGKSFAQSCHLKRHERTIHSKEKPYCCTHCGKCFGQSAGLKRHQQVHEGGRLVQKSTGVSSQVFPCSWCTFCFTSEQTLHKHIRRHHPEEHVDLPLSGRTNSDGPASNLHHGPSLQASISGRARRGKGVKRLVAPINPKGQQTEPETPQYGCALCWSSFGDSESLKTHQCTPEQEGSYCCHKCCGTFGDKGSLETHQCTPSGDGPYCCPQCGKCFTRSCNLRRHERTIHTQEKPYFCTQCGKFFSQSAGLKRHQQTHVGLTPRLESTGVASRVFPCPQCAFSFTAEHYLHKHLKRYHPEEHLKLLESGLANEAQEDSGQLSCRQCQKTFTCLKTLRLHKCTQSGDRLFLCTDCGKCFTWSYSLRQHQRIHTGEKPFTCSECGKSFIHSGQLNVHKRIHTGEKPFLCTVCGERFRQSGDLKRHERKHTGFRPCRCSECGKSFSRPQSLRAHQLLHKGEKLYCCTQCNKSFARSWHLRRHHHKMHS
ncbi:histone-lysine N-methyltransferase PRDM9 isoform X2 [Brienomyrus brachyistius]|uniref:histone-lysine N-methyltransferase PRDM9 isoform X2 n=1 Tax=Brienomyrus brachyistius TaxID=42636 RepID=UPI0020B4571F|nr:histone-lysine N-methyltransferase PRDM9 isoform X2 [Brienomyrus brachyistius]